MKKTIAALCILICSSSCAGAKPFLSSPGPALYTTQEIHASMAPGLSGIIGDILSHPDQYSENPVEIVGYFRGWDLLHETRQAPPVSRSDWVIADSSGAIYVTGLVPQGLDPSSLAATNTVIRISARVEHEEGQGVVFLHAESVELVARNTSTKVWSAP
jgi:hypothetical protein